MLPLFLTEQQLSATSSSSTLVSSWNFRFFVLLFSATDFIYEAKDFTQRTHSFNNYHVLEDGCRVLYARYLKVFNKGTCNTHLSHI